MVEVYNALKDCTSGSITSKASRRSHLWKTWFRHWSEKEPTGPTVRRRRITSAVPEKGHTCGDMAEGKKIV
jgi:hypothetical protein